MPGTVLYDDAHYPANERFKEGNVLIIFATFINSVAFLQAVLQLNARKLHTWNTRETAGG